MLRRYIFTADCFCRQINPSLVADNLLCRIFYWLRQNRIIAVYVIVVQKRENKKGKDNSLYHSSLPSIRFIFSLNFMQIVDNRLRYDFNNPF